MHFSGKSSTWCKKYRSQRLGNSAIELGDVENLKIWTFQQAPTSLSGCLLLEILLLGTLPFHPTSLTAAMHYWVICNACWDTCNRSVARWRKLKYPPTLPKSNPSTRLARVHLRYYVWVSPRLQIEVSPKSARRR